MSSNQLRSLMKERQQAKRIAHPYARYVGNKLTCTVCGGMSVKSEPLWASHLTSKSHRVAVQKQLREKEEAEAKAREAAAKGKRRADEDAGGDGDGDGGAKAAVKRVRIVDDVDDEAPDEADEEADVVVQKPLSGLPPGFFDDPSQAPPPGADSASSPPSEAVDEEDPEWAAFEAALNTPDQAERVGNAFSRATVTAEPVMYEAPGQEGEAAEAEEAREQASPGEEGPQETEEERRIREEKEEIMERIEAEEREQAEADERVSRMKARLDAIRAERQLKSSVKSKV